MKLSVDPSSYFLKKNSQDLLDIDWQTAVDYLKLEAPLIYCTLGAVTAREGKSPLQNPLPADNIVIAMVASMLVYNANHKTSRIQHALGLLLDHGGATKEVTSV